MYGYIAKMSNKQTNGFHTGGRGDGPHVNGPHVNGQSNTGTTATVTAPTPTRSRPQSSTSSLSNTNQTDGYVGFANLPNQVYRKSVKKGFEFTLMVVGESGLGKSTLVNSMFIADLYNEEKGTVTSRRNKTLSIEKTTVLLKEGSVQLKLTVVDTPGFGDVVDNSNCWQPIINYVETRFDEYLNAETKVNRKIISDDRVHCCIYFISPTGHGLKQLDIEFMKRLHDKVNIIPLIAKADTMTPDECKAFKKTILSEIHENKIRIYEFPETEDDEDNKQQKKHKDRIPFAVVGSNTLVETSSGRKVRGRVYPWGVVEVENLEHNDYITLRNMLIRTHMQDLKDITNNVHYENFRYKRLSSSTSKKGNEDKDPMTLIAEEKKEHNLLLQKRTVEMEHLFEQKVKDKLEKLQESDISLTKKKLDLKALIEQQQQVLDEKRKQFEKEKEQESGTLKHKKKLLAF